MATNTENPAGDNLDEIDKETLVSLLRDKGKEMRQLSSKLNKLEEKYVKIFKENKNYVKDKEAIEKILRAVFSNEADKFLPYDSGFLDAQKIADTFQQKKEHSEQEKSTLVTGLVSAREETEKRNQELALKLEEAEKKLAAQENDIGSSKTRLEEQDTIIKKFTQEIAELNEIITSKNQEMLKYKKLEDEMASLKAESLIKELRNKTHNDTADLRVKFEQSDRTDQILRLKNEVEDAYDKISRLEREKAELNVQISKLGGNNKKQAGAKRDFEMQVNFDAEGEKLSDQNGTPTNHLGQLGAMDSPGDFMGIARRRSLEWKENGEFIPKEQHVLNQQYLKNVVLKYFIYSVGENEKEASLLMSAICTILKMSREERNMIEQARKTTLWGKTKNLIYDTVVGKSDTQPTHPAHPTG